MPLLKTVTPQLLGSSNPAGDHRNRPREAASVAAGGFAVAAFGGVERVQRLASMLDRAIRAARGGLWTFTFCGTRTWVDDGGHGYRHPQQAYDHANSQHFVWGDWASDRVYIITKKLNNKKHSNMIICV